MLHKKINFLLVLILIISTQAKSQGIVSSVSGKSNSQQHFLWYTGRWSKNKKNTFITEAYSDSLEGGMLKMSGGSTITVNTDGGVNINSADIDSWNKKITDGINSLDKTEKELTDPSKQTQEWAYHFNKVTMSQLDSIKTTWVNYKIDKKENPLNPEKGQNTPLQNFSNDLNDWCKNIQPKYQSIIDFYNAHRHDKESDYHNPDPPQFDFTCIACDTNLVKEHDKESAGYVDKFFKPESDLMKDALLIIRQLLLIGRSNDYDNTPVDAIVDADMKDKIDQAFHKDKNDPSKSGACAYFDSYQLGQAVQFLAQRCLWRAEKLVRDQHKNFKTAIPVIRTYLTAARENELMGFQVDEHFDQLGEMVKDVYYFYYNKLTKDHDWTQLANIPFIFQLARQYNLLTGKEIDESNTSRILKILNNFYLNIELDIKVGKGQGYSLAHLKGKEKIAPEFAYSQDSCYEWVVTEDKPNEIGEPIKKADQKIETDLLSNEVVMPNYRPTYTGTKKYWCTLQQLKMDYCHPGKDTILLSGFIPSPNPMSGTWRYPNDPNPVPAGINSLDHFFQDINKIKELAQSGKAKEQAEIIKNQAEQLAAKMKSMQQQMGNKQGASQIANYQKMQDFATQTKQLMNNQNFAPMLYIDFPLQSQNNNTTLFEKRFDAKEINPQLSNDVIYGYYTVKIEYKE